MNRFSNNDALRKVNRRIVLGVFEWIGMMVTILVALSLISAYFVRFVGVDGDSMLPTLKDKNVLLLSSIHEEYEYGEIVVIDRYTKEPLIKRIIAVGGDQLVIDARGQVLVNDVLLNETYISGKTARHDFPGEMTIPQGYVFVMGDNRSVSKDSRMDEIGLIPVKDIVGRVVGCVWPLSSAGLIK